MCFFFSFCRNMSRSFHQTKLILDQFEASVRGRLVALTECTKSRWPDRKRKRKNTINQSTHHQQRSMEHGTMWRSSSRWRARTKTGRAAPSCGSGESDGDFLNIEDLLSFFSSQLKKQNERNSSMIWMARQLGQVRHAFPNQKRLVTIKWLSDQSNRGGDLFDFLIPTRCVSWLHLDDESRWEVGWNQMNIKKEKTNRQLVDYNHWLH